MHHPNLYILTGGPGAGKTTLLQELQRRGFHTVPEIARQLVQEQVQTGGTALPWADRRRYAELMLEWSIHSFEKQDSAEVAFCDRGIPDVLCYMRLIGLDEREAIAACRVYRYAPRVFLAAPWEAIYTTDSERKQDFAEAVRTAALMAEVYRECGYEVIALPFASPQERADFILQQYALENDG